MIDRVSEITHYELMKVVILLGGFGTRLREGTEMFYTITEFIRTT